MRRAWLLVAIAACDGQLTAEGTHHHYVVNKLELPANAAEATQFAVGDGDAKLNQVGAAFAALAASGFNAELGDDAAIASANVLLLVDFQTLDYVDAAAAGVRVLLGTNPSPSPCSSATDCGHHLTGAGNFEVSFQSQDLAQLVGIMRGGTFESAAGSLSIQISLGNDSAGGSAHEVPLIGARVIVNAASDTALAGVIGGAVPRDKMMELASSLTLDLELISDACSGSGGTCTCPSAYTQSLLATLDANHDCLITSDEAAVPFAGVTDADTSVDGVSAISFGVGFHAVPGAFDD